MASQITVAIPTYNGRAYIEQALRSVLAQDPPPFELIVCDDRSEDETLEVVRRLAGDRAQVVVNSERLGLAGNWNRCVELAATDWVAVFHQDDVMRPGHLALHAAVIAELADPGATAFVGGQAEAIDEVGETLDPRVIDWGVVDAKRGGYERQVVLNELWRVLEYGVGEFLRELAVSNPVRCSAVTLNRSHHRAIGGFDPAWKYALDWDYWVRAARAAGVAWVVAAGAQPTVAFRWHGGSETHRFRVGTLDLDEQARLLESLFANDGAHWSDARGLKRAANERLARGYLNRAYVAAKAGDGMLCRRALKEAWSYWPGICGLILTHPRLAARLASGWVGPKARRS